MLPPPVKMTLFVVAASKEFQIRALRRGSSRRVLAIVMPTRQFGGFSKYSDSYRASPATHSAVQIQKNGKIQKFQPSFNRRSTRIDTDKIRVIRVNQWP